MDARIIYLTVRMDANLFLIHWLEFVVYVHRKDAIQWNKTRLNRREVDAPAVVPRFEKCSCWGLQKISAEKVLTTLAVLSTTVIDEHSMS